MSPLPSILLLLLTVTTFLTPSTTAPTHPPPPTPLITASPTSIRSLVIRPTRIIPTLIRPTTIRIPRITLIPKPNPFPVPDPGPLVPVDDFIGFGKRDAEPEAHPEAEAGEYEIEGRNVVPTWFTLNPTLLRPTLRTPRITLIPKPNPIPIPDPGPRIPRVGKRAPSPHPEPEPEPPLLGVCTSRRCLENAPPIEPDPVPGPVKPPTKTTTAAATKTTKAGPKKTRCPVIGPGKSGRENLPECWE
ncbi:hypothetical protein EX30DRAFT_343625 [Ascodesmis nigricans]|uniref:Uncharacterized protein n=1 Tax=Ascodesmis nigricans TaxID=341454 RepID=A0A4S2MRY4_9PEZI|nr:hypothetical protein EX30DRAFT_343625 [Ascodesmis nigricans]